MSINIWDALFHLGLFVLPHWYKLCSVGPSDLEVNIDLFRLCIRLTAPFLPIFVVVMIWSLFYVYIVTVMVLRIYMCWFGVIFLWDFQLWFSVVSVATFRLITWIYLMISIWFSEMQDFVEQWRCAGPGDGEGTSGRSLRDMRQGFRWADCSALCRTHHGHQDLPEHHRAHHQLPQQNQTGKLRDLLTKMDTQGLDETITSISASTEAHGFKSSDSKFCNCIQNQTCFFRFYWSLCTWRRSYLSF